MKTIAFNSSTKVEQSNAKNNPSTSQSPYLKAILTGAIKLLRTEQWLDDRAAASRYIRESSGMRG